MRDRPIRLEIWEISSFTRQPLLIREPIRKMVPKFIGRFFGHKLSLMGKLFKQIILMIGLNLNQF